MTARPPIAQFGDAIEVTQADRDAAAVRHGYGSWEDMMYWASGKERDAVDRTAALIATTRKATSTALPLAHPAAPQGEEVVAQIVSWLRHQSDLGANRGNEADKGTTKRAAFGGGSLALKRAADAIESGEYLTNDNALAPAAIASGRGEGE